MTQQTGRMSRRVLVSALSLLFGTAAHAGFYPGLVDPGGNGEDVPGFTATFVVDVPDSCIHFGDSGWEPTNQIAGASGGCGDASLVSGTVFLYSTSTSPPTGAPLDSFTLDPRPLLGVYSVNGALKGIDTDPMGPYSGSSFYMDDQFWLQFASGFCEACTPPGGSDFSFDPAFLAATFPQNIGPPGTVTFGPECETAENCVVPAVPEPGTMSLVLGALAGGWWARRRKPNGAA